MPHLQHLELQGTPVLDLSPLASLQELSSLDIRETKIEDYKPLLQIKRLDPENDIYAEPEVKAKIRKLRSEISAQ